MTDVSVDEGPSDPASRTQKVDEGSIVSHLLFVFFGHQGDEYRAVQVKNSKARATARDELIKILNTLFDAIRTQEFDRKHYQWITDALIQNNFKPRTLYQYYDDIKGEDIRFKKARAWRLRTVFSAMCAIAREVFKDSASEFDYVSEIRARMRLPEGPYVDKDAARILGQIETTLKKIANRPAYPIIYDGQGQPVIRTKVSTAFASAENVSQYKKAIEGRYFVFRKVFSTAHPDRKYIREYLEIDESRSETYVRWQTRGGEFDQKAEFLGIAFFIRNGFWLMTHCSDPYPRVRMLAAGMNDWRKHKSDPEKTPFCMGYITSHIEVDGVVVPRARRLFCRRQTDHDIKTIPVDSRVDFLNSDQIEAEISPERLAQLENG
jgi:hypothetical protein